MSFEAFRVRLLWYAEMKQRKDCRAKRRPKRVKIGCH